MGAGRKDPLARAEQYSDEPEKFWQPKPGDVVSGTVLGIEMRSSEHDPRVPVLLLETDEEEIVSVWAFWTVLRGEMLKARPQPGERIAVKRLADSDRGYRRYKAFVDRAQEFSWDNVNPNAGDLDPDDRKDVEADLAKASGPAKTPSVAELTEPDDDLPF